VRTDRSDLVRAAGFAECNDICPEAFRARNTLGPGTGDVEISRHVAAFESRVKGGEQSTDLTPASFFVHPLRIGSWPKQPTARRRP
jgi:hypothetical protein